MFFFPYAIPSDTLICTSIFAYECYRHVIGERKQNRTNILLFLRRTKLSRPCRAPWKNLVTLNEKQKKRKKKVVNNVIQFVNTMNFLRAFCNASVIRLHHALRDMWSVIVKTHEGSDWYSYRITRSGRAQLAAAIHVNGPFNTSRNCISACKREQERERRWNRAKEGRMKEIERDLDSRR